MGGSVYGIMIKATLYLTDDQKRRLKREVRRRGMCEVGLIRAAVDAAVDRPQPRAALFHGDDEVADRVDELLDGFGTR